MHPICETEAARHDTETGAPMRELKEAYEAGLLVTTVTADMINDNLLSALFEDVPPANNLVH